MKSSAAACRRILLPPLQPAQSRPQHTPIMQARLCSGEAAVAQPAPAGEEKFSRRHLLLFVAELASGCWRWSFHLPNVRAGSGRVSEAGTAAGAQGPGGTSRGAAAWKSFYPGAYASQRRSTMLSSLLLLGKLECRASPTRPVAGQQHAPPGRPTEALLAAILCSCGQCLCAQATGASPEACTAPRTTTTGGTYRGCNRGAGQLRGHERGHKTRPWHKMRDVCGPLLCSLHTVPRQPAPRARPFCTRAIDVFASGGPGCVEGLKSDLLGERHQCRMRARILLLAARHAARRSPPKTTKQRRGRRTRVAACADG